ncbi:hypothetical protein [Fulvivirga sedimenti]|uniref:Uncharacterized protein n=1 Tax=Fulvivirga sedimenti TaxID=2879465 RepID=A0A9X1HR60_9BACT|nr:hypothetical protein [Fulvivirga sedimenti]MCA6074523.1 hypothetical protein [Fulvivirga sedimenti]MCA6075700.1 hypothetical protein [Fulvivirga sedimenti]MCA6076828.1 hypothetical protein [Fulvivirga sedimenti]
MKINFTLIFALLVAALSGCQEEVVEITDPSPQNVVTANSQTAILIQRTATNDGSFDNIVDGSSCIYLAFPYSVYLNDIEYLVSSSDDLDDLEKLIEESDDDDSFDIKYPITVVTSDYSEILVNNEDQLEALTEDCTEGGADDDIECLDFEYPFTISVYDASNQLADVITINNDKELYELIDNLDDDDFISFNFPITIVLWDGQEIVVRDNDSLEDLIEDVADDCDEDDDNDFDDDDVDDSEFVSVITDGRWMVSLLNDEIDYTSDLQSYILEFRPDGILHLKNNDREIVGTWESDGNSGNIELEISIEDNGVDLDDAIKALKNSWEIISYDETEIKSTDDLEEQTDEDTAFLTLKKLN